ncbi:MAG: beta-glucuronidase, partial [Agathobacter sp.]|nr:beta-glucuronidase [Agathobacter sp.]
MVSSLLYPRVTSTRRAISLDGMWNFQFDSASEGVVANWANGLPTPVLMPVPSSFCDIFTDKDSREYAGDFWYETDFFVPGEWEGNEVVIRFASATHKARVFI